MRLVLRAILAGCMCAACGRKPAVERSDEARPVTTGEARPDSQPVTTGASGDTVARGVVAVIGADPLSQVVVNVRLGQETRQVAVLGPLRAELGTLHGAEVEVRGTAVANVQPAPLRAVLVTSYEVVAINGERPIVGVLEHKQDGRSVSGTHLVGAPEELAQAVGSKVWVLGRPSNGGIVVQAYGIIRRP